MKVLLNREFADAFYRETGIETLPLNPFSNLDVPVRSHSDMLLFVIDREVFCYSEYRNENKEVFDAIEKEGYEVVEIDEKCSSSYPDDVWLNALVMGKYIFAKLSNLAKKIKDYAKENGYVLVNVNQGYTACSTLKVNEESAITADIGIYNAIIGCKKRCLLINSGDIKLKGYDMGFIGGASVSCNGKIYFFGDISKHRDYEKISSFVKSEKCEDVSLSLGEVYDFGGGNVIR